jgi:hypothetical protein
MKPGLFRVVRGFFINGEIQRVDSLVRLTDVETIGPLMAVGKIAPADAETMRRIGKAETVIWEPPKDPPEIRSPWQAVPARLALAGVRRKQ